MPSLRALDQGGGIGDLVEDTVIQFVGARGTGGDRHIVRDDDERRVGFAGDLLQEGHDRAARVWIEGAGRLVGEDHARAAHEGAGDRDALLLAAAHLTRVRVRAVPKAHALQHVQGDRAPAQQLRTRRVHEGYLDVFGGRARRENVELLEDEAEIRPPHAGATPLAQARRIHAVQLVGARRGGIQQADDVEHRRLTRARPADDRDMFSRRDVQIDTTQNVQVLAVGQGDRSGHAPQAHQAHRAPVPSDASAAPSMAPPSIPAPGPGP